MCSIDFVTENKNCYIFPLRSFRKYLRCIVDAHLKEKKKKRKKTDPFTSHHENLNPKVREDHEICTVCLMTEY